MLRQIKPRNARSKRALEHREPKQVENPKTALLLRGTTCSQIVQNALTDLYTLRQPNAKKFTKKNAVRPFEDASSLEFFSEKNDASLMVFGNSTKKRPHTLTFARLYAHRILDMVELHLEADVFRTLSQFKGRKPVVGLRPMVVFAGTAFESPISNEYTLVRSIFTDFFASRETVDSVDVEGLQYIISISAEEPEDSESTDASLKTPIYVRAYMIRTQRSGQKLPRVEVEEMGPRMNFRIGRTRVADESVMKEALKKPKTTEEKPKKNISTDGMGDKIGRIHLGRQDLSELQTRKMKGLKRSRDIVVEDSADAESTEVTKKVKA